MYLWAAKNLRLDGQRDRGISSGRALSIRPWEITAEGIAITCFHGRRENIAKDIPQNSTESLSRYIPYGNLLFCFLGNLQPAWLNVPGYKSYKIVFKN